MVKRMVVFFQNLSAQFPTSATLFSKQIPVGASARSCELQRFYFGVLLIVSVKLFEGTLFPGDKSAGMHVLIYVCVVLLVMQVLLANGQLDVILSSGGDAVPAELVWDGGVQVTMRSTGTPFDITKFEDTVQVPFSTGDLVEVPITTYGFNTFQNVIFPYVPLRRDVEGQILRMTMQPAQGFVANANMSVAITFDRFAFGGDRVRGTLRIAPNLPGGGQADFTVLQGRDEFAVRRYGVSVQIALKYNVFTRNTASIIVENYDGLELTWSRSLASSRTLLLLSIGPLSSFNVSRGQGAAFKFRITPSDVYLPMLRSEGWTFTLPVESVDGVPRTYCRVSKTLIYVKELMAADQLISISLEDPAADEFNHTMVGFNSILLASVSIPTESGLTARVASKNRTTVVVMLSMNTSFAIFRNVYVYVSVPPILLASRESGCGGSTINIAPSAGTVRGVGFTNLGLTEIAINENVTRLRIEAERDLFVEPESSPYPILVQAVSLDGTPVSDNPIVTRFMQSVAKTGVMQIGGGGTYADIVFPASAAYNIPEGTTERLRVVIPGSVLASGVDPIMQNVDFEIKSVQATFTVTFNGPTNGRVSIRELWNATGNLIVWFIIRGDRWNAAAAVSWGYRRPFFYSNFFSAYNTNEHPVLDFSKVHIEESGKIAKVPFLSVVNISTNGEQRVLVHEISLLTEGGASTFSSFLVLPTSPSDIIGTYSGSAEDVSAVTPKFVTEDDVRAGLSFAVTLRNQVFANINSISIALIFFNAASLAPFVTLANGTLDATGRVLTVSLPPLPAYDIYGPDGVALRVPDSFFFEGVVPASPIEGRINIKSLPGPICTLNVSQTITEINVREGDIAFFVKSDKRFWTNITSLSDLKRFATGTAASKEVLIEPVRVVDEFTLEMRIVKNISYDIVASDSVSITVTRFMFEIQEGCSGSMHFDIAVQPGTVDFIGLPANITESFLRSNNISASLSITNEQVISQSFALEVHAAPKRSSSGLHHAFSTKTVTANQIPGTTGMFSFVIPQLPTLDVFDVEEFTLSVPTKVLASNRTASHSNNTVSVNPVSESILMLFDAVIDEHVIVDGGMQFQFIAEFGCFVNASLIVNTLRVTASEGSQVPDPGLFRDIFTPRAVTFSHNGSRMNITLPPYPHFNLHSGNLSVTFSIPPAAMASGLSPIPSVVTFFIVSQLPVLRFSGSALYGGSRDLLMSSLVLNVVLANDVFTDAIDSSICPRQLQCVFVMSDDSRSMTIQIRTSAEFTSIRAVTKFQISFPATAFENGIAPLVNTATVTIFPQGGILEEVIDLTNTYEESVFREGGLPSFTLRVTGDEFIPDTAAITNSIVEGIVCIPVRDEYDFCGRIRHLINSIRLSDGNRAATVYLQRDYEFDIFAQQMVQLHVTGDAFLSKQAPIAREAIQFTVYPVAGSVYYSNAAASISANVLRGDTSDTPLDIAFTFTLVGERWASDASTKILEGIGVTPSTQQTGFTSFKSSMFAPAVISANGRVIVLRMRHVPSYDISTQETLTMNVNEDAVLSKKKPSLTSTANQFVITVGGSVIELTSLQTLWADGVALNGMLLSVRSSTEWDTLAVSTGSLQAPGVLRSLSSVASEPHGFARYSTPAPGLTDAMAMAPVLHGNIAPGDKVLTISIPPNSKYSLLKEEVLVITFPSKFQQGSNKGAFTPQSLSVRILPQMKTLLLMVRNPSSADSVAHLVASLLGIFVSRIDVTAFQAYGDEQNLYSRVSIVIRDGDSADDSSSLSSAEATERLYSATRETRASCCNISAIYWASAPPTKEQSDIDLGLEAPPERVQRSTDLLWVYIGVGALALIAVGAIVWWKVYGAMMDSGRNRVRREEPESNWEPLLFVPKGDLPMVDGDAFEMASRTALRALSVADGTQRAEESFTESRDGPHRAREHHRLDGDTDEFTSGPSLGGGPRPQAGHAGHKVTFDVDDLLYAGQPSHIVHEERRLRENAQPRQTVQQPPMMPMSEDDVVVFPQRFHDSPDYRRMRQHMYERRRERRM